MTDVFSKHKRSEVMSRIRSKNTKPEMKVRKFLYGLGFRYRLHDKKLPGKPDIILKKYNTVIQVRGCFWHGHNCKVDHKPKSNQEYWELKIEKNMARDQKNDSLLRDMGWNVIVIWECECRKADLFEKVMKDTIRKLTNKKIE